MISYSCQEGKPEKELLGSIRQLYAALFGQIDEIKFLSRIDQAKDLFTTMAWENARLAGFKMGYAKDAHTFYSWIGGVHNDFRKQGIAQQLMHQQHIWCGQKGFTTIQTKTMNRWKPMLILNLKNGFDITQTYTDSKGELKIILEKKITS